MFRPGCTYACCAAAARSLLLPPERLLLGHAAAQVVYGHLDDPEHQDIQRGVSYLNLRPGASPLLAAVLEAGQQAAGC